MKYYINLIQKEGKDRYRLITVLTGFLLAALSLFTVSLLIKPDYDALSEIDTKIELARDELERLTSENSGYDTVLSEYIRYGWGYLSEKEKTYADRESILKKIDEYIISEGAVMKMQLTGNELSATVFDVSMDKASAIIETMMSDPEGIVDYVTTRTANNERMIVAAGSEREEIRVPAIEMKALFRDGGSGESN